MGTDTLLNDMLDLEKQATTERSHYYVASILDRAIREILALRAQLDQSRRDQLATYEEFRNRTV